MNQKTAGEKTREKSHLDGSVTANPHIKAKCECTCVCEWAVVACN